MRSVGILCYEPLCTYGRQIYQLYGEQRRIRQSKTEQNRAKQSKLAVESLNILPYNRLSAAFISLTLDLRAVFDLYISERHAIQE